MGLSVSSAWHVFFQVTLVIDSLGILMDGYQASDSFKCFPLHVESRLPLVEPKDHFFVS